MQTAYTEALISSFPTGELVTLAVAFALAALVLFALAVEAGNYPKISKGVRQARSALRGHRGQHWQGESLST